MKAEQDRVRTLLLSTITQLCQNGLQYKRDLKVQGLLAITIDSKDVFVVQLNESVAAKERMSSAKGFDLASLGFKDCQSPDIRSASRASAVSELGMRSMSAVGSNEPYAMYSKAKSSSGYIHKVASQSMNDPFGGHGAGGGGDHHTKSVDQNGEHSSMTTGGGEKETTGGGGGHGGNSSMFMTPFNLPLASLNFPAAVKGFQGGPECFRDSNSDHMDFAFQEFTQSVTTVSDGHCRLPLSSSGPAAVSSNSNPDLQEFPANTISAAVHVGQSFTHFESMLSPQNSSTKQPPVPRSVSHMQKFGSQELVAVSSKKPKQDSRLPRRPRESPEKRFLCPLCNLTYYYKKHLKFHMQQKHSIQQHVT